MVSHLCAQHRLHLTAFPFAVLRGRFAVGAGTRQPFAGKGEIQPSRLAKSGGR